MNISATSAAQSGTISTQQTETRQEDSTSSAAAPAGGSAGNAPKAGGGGGAIAASSQSEEDALEAIIEAAKRRVQAIIGPAQVDEVVAKDGSINYQKLADLVNEQQMKKLAESGGPIANLLA